MENQQQLTQEVPFLMLFSEKLQADDTIPYQTYAGATGPNNKEDYTDDK